MTSRQSTCGAENRKGTLCKNKPVDGKKRCKFHGGLSTGPRTAAGKARVQAALIRGYRKWFNSKPKPSALPVPQPAAGPSPTHRPRPVRKTAPNLGGVQWVPRSLSGGGRSSYIAVTDFKVF